MDDINKEVKKTGKNFSKKVDVFCGYCRPKPDNYKGIKPKEEQEKGEIEEDSAANSIKNLVSEAIYRKRKAIYDGMSYNGKLNDECLWPRNIVTFKFDEGSETIKPEVLKAIEVWNSKIGDTVKWVEHDPNRRKLPEKQVLKIQKTQGEWYTTIGFLPVRRGNYMKLTETFEGKPIS